MDNCVWYFCIYLYGLSLNGWHAIFCITNNRHYVTITTDAITRHFLIWKTTVGQPTKRQCSCVLTLKYTFICAYWWTRQIIHNTLIVVDRYLYVEYNIMSTNDSRSNYDDGWYYENPLHFDVVNRYLRPMGDKTIPDSAGPRLESFDPPFVAGIDLPHQSVVDSHSIIHHHNWSDCRLSTLINHLPSSDNSPVGTRCLRVTRVTCVWQ